MRHPLALGLLLALAACNRHGAADVTLDADATTRNATAAKTLSDLAAADAASREPAPIVHDAAPADVEHDAKPARAATPTEATDEAPAESQDDAVSND